jgi:ElaB/YqjD/DUF883 family membrane-anchored ribosome-binding protein
MDDETIQVAQQADAARRRLSASFAQVKDRLTPRAIANEAIVVFKDKATQTAQASLGVVRRNPSTAIGVAAAAVLLLFRKPIFGAMRRLTNKENKNGG